jgi:hypothetical protein
MNGPVEPGWGVGRMRRASRARSFSPCGRRWPGEAGSDEGSPLTRAAAAAACSTLGSSPRAGSLPQGERWALRHAPSVPGTGSGITAVQRADLGPKEGSGMPVLRPSCGALCQGWVHRSLPTSRGGLFDPGRGTLKGWADGSARSPGYRNRDRGTRPPLRQRCPVSTAVPPPETSVSDIGIKAGIVKCHVMAVLGLDPRIGPAIHEGGLRCTDRRRHGPGWTWMAGPSPAMTRGCNVRASRPASGEHLSMRSVGRGMAGLILRSGPRMATTRERRSSALPRAQPSALSVCPCLTPP